jgi:hypothetical protein
MQDAAPAAPFNPRFWTLAALVALAMGVRLVIAFVPGVIPYNFTPVEAIALFGGAYFADRRAAILVPLVAMFLADLAIGLHALIPIVYGCIALTVLLGERLRGRVKPFGVLGYGFLGSLIFFLVTNFALWATHGTEFCRAGLGECYVAALPFFKNWLAGTWIWSAVLFGAFELLRVRFPALRSDVAAAA